MRRKRYLALPLTFVLLLQACGGGFAGQLRIILAASAPLLDSLVASGAITPTMRSGLLVDFTDLATGAATLKTDLDACATSKPCKLDAVSRYQMLFESVERRGHFGSNPRIQQIEIILRGIVSAARVYYGGSPMAGEGVTGGPLPTQAQAGDALKLKVKQLKIAMQP